MSAALSGIRVLDLTIIAAGAGATMLLGDFGAEVIKVESTRYIDPFRRTLIYPDGEPGAQPWNRAAPFHTMNRNKMGITLDLTTPRGRELFLELVKRSDVVANNFRVGVMAQLGLDYPVLKAVNPSLIVIDISSQGTSGPEAEYRSYGSTIDAISGLAFVTGFEDGPPVWSGQTVNYPDQLACTSAAGAILAGLYRRAQTGEGCHIELSQREAVTSLLGEMIIDKVLNGREPKRTGNAHPRMAPHGVYPCAGDDEWVTIAVRSDEEWVRFCAAIDRQGMAGDARLRELAGRCAHRDEIDGVIAEWTISRRPYDVFDYLAPLGFAAGPVAGGPEVLDDRHLKARGYFVELGKPGVGVHPIKSRPMRLSRTDGSIRTPAPDLGEHNWYVLGEILGLSGDEMSRLEERGVLGIEPADW